MWNTISSGEIARRALNDAKAVQTLPTRGWTGQGAPTGQLDDRDGMSQWLRAIQQAGSCIELRIAADYQTKRERQNRTSLGLWWGKIAEAAAEAEKEGHEGAAEAEVMKNLFTYARLLYMASVAVPR